MANVMSDDELERQLTSARRALPAWNPGRQQQLKWATAAELVGRRRRAPWVLGLATVAAMGVTILAWVGTQRLGEPLGWTSFLTAPAVSSSGPVAGGTTGPTASSELALPKLADGTSIVLDGPSAVLKKTVETPDEVSFQLESGGAHFEVARRPSRVFRVHAGTVMVQVIGTRFHVQRQDGRSHINVDRGRVLVSWWGGSQELGAGEEGTFPPAEPAAASAPPPAEPAPKHGPVAARPLDKLDPNALFARADRARLDGRPELAIAQLRQIVDHHPADAHAPIAAFTMGRLLLESLKRPAEAAGAFARARSLARGGPLTEDALAREVEALHAAGDTTTARARAELYRQLFPNGPRLRAVLRFGGLRDARPNPRSDR